MFAPFLRLVFFSLLAAVALPAQMGPAGGSRNRGDTAGSYRLSERDLIHFSVFNEPELEVVQRIDGTGHIRIPLAGSLKVAGLTVAEAEQAAERAFVEERILRYPLVMITISEYSPKEVAVFGAVARPGKLRFPPEIERMSIVEAISEVGGFTPVAKSDAVRITRESAGNDLQTINVDVSRIIQGREDGRDSDTVYVYPGDLIWIPERLF